MHQADFPRVTFRPGLRRLMRRAACATGPSRNEALVGDGGALTLSSRFLNSDDVFDRSPECADKKGAGKLFARVTGRKKGPSVSIRRAIRRARRPARPNAGAGSGKLAHGAARCRQCAPQRGRTGGTRPGRMMDRAGRGKRATPAPRRPRLER